MKLDSGVFFTKDIKRAVSFYRDMMGFKVDYINSNFASFIFSNGAKLGIKIPSKDREVPGHQTIFIQVGDINKFLQETKSKNLKFYENLSELKGWGKFYSILDPDGNKVLFIEPEK